MSAIITAKKMEDIRELTEPAQIGVFYWVPCVKVRKYPNETIRRLLPYQGMWMPVVGGFHEDPEISSKFGLHIHPDWRFVSNTVLKRFLYPHEGVIIHSRDMEDMTLVLKRRKMQRFFTFPSNVCQILEPIYLGKESGCSVCPHRGVSLAGLSPDAEGNVICPGHGLKVRQATGLVVRRFPEPLARSNQNQSKHNQE
jgi:hypothetical protein